MEYKLRPRPRVFDLAWGGTHEPVQQLGKGRFCTAYQSLNRADLVWLVVQQHHGDYSKEILIEAGMESNRYIPQLEHVGDMGEATVYQTRFYHKLTAVSKGAWREYRILQRAREAVWRTVPTGPCKGLDVMDAIIKAVECAVSGELLEALAQIRDSCTNYGQSYTFEFAPRNLAVNDDGGLILLDPVFNLETIERDRITAERKRRAHARY